MMRNKIFSTGNSNGEQFNRYFTQELDGKYLFTALNKYTNVNSILIVVLCCYKKNSPKYFH